MSELALPSQVRIELIDDDADQRRAVGRLFARRGFRELIEAADAQEGLRLAGQHQPHLILLDLAMPGRSGTEVLPDLRVASPHSTIVVLSNLPRRRLLNVVLRRGAAGFVEKSVLPEHLVDEILVTAALTDVVQSHVLDLPPTATAAAAGRRFASELLSVHDRRLVADVSLLVSELVTNAVLHADSQPRLAVHMLRGRVRVEVFDHDSRPPQLREPDRDGPGGRGLQIIATLSSRWGTEPVDGGKVVWFEIDVTPGCLA